MLKPGRRRPRLAAPTQCSESHSNDNGSGSVSPPGDANGQSPSSAEISPVETDTDGVEQPDSGVLVDRGGNSGGSNAEQRNNLAARFSKGSYGQSTWAKMLLSLPLEVAAAASRADSHYLQKRKRKHWWSKDHFPKVILQPIPAQISDVRLMYFIHAMILRCAPISMCNTATNIMQGQPASAILKKLDHKLLFWNLGR